MAVFLAVAPVDADCGTPVSELGGTEMQRTRTPGDPTLTVKEVPSSCATASTSRLWLAAAVGTVSGLFLVTVAVLERRRVLHRV